MQEAMSKRKQSTYAVRYRTHAVIVRSFTTRESDTASFLVSADDKNDLVEMLKECVDKLDAVLSHEVQISAYKKMDRSHEILCMDKNADLKESKRLVFYRRISKHDFGSEEIANELKKMLWGEFYALKNNVAE